MELVSTGWTTERSCGLIYGKGISYFSNPEHPDQFWSLFSIIFSGTEGEATKM
jgi:hypothetical protein